MASGILNVNKPSGPTSFYVVRSARRLPGVRKVGHAGTLDPVAEGVLPLLINAATRLADFIHEWPKTYLAQIVFGATSDTDDREGRLTAAGDPTGITADRITAALPSFVGRVEQVPPAYSALKQGGEPLYRKARRGETVQVHARPVEITSLSLKDYNAGQATALLEVQGGRGMYVRSLARDLGATLGCGAYLRSLTRMNVGPLSLETAITVEALAAMGEEWTKALLPLDLPLRSWPAITLTATQAIAVRQGQRIDVETSPAGRHRILDDQGNLVGWGEVAASGVLQPRAVFDP